MLVYQRVTNQKVSGHSKIPPLLLNRVKLAPVCIKVQEFLLASATGASTTLAVSTLCHWSVGAFFPAAWCVLLLRILWSNSVGALVRFRWQCHSVDGRAEGQDAASTPSLVPGFSIFLRNRQLPNPFAERCMVSTGCFIRDIRDWAICKYIWIWTCVHVYAISRCLLMFIDSLVTINVYR